MPTRRGFGSHRPCLAAARSPAPSTRARWGPGPGRRDHAGGAFRSGWIPADHAAARRRGADVLAYVELHIEQGPVLEARKSAGRGGDGHIRRDAAAVGLTGMAGHAGTVPMALRRDALAAPPNASSRSRHSAGPIGSGLVGTVGVIQRRPGRNQCHSRAGYFHHRCAVGVGQHRRRAVAEPSRRRSRPSPSAASGIAGGCHP